MGALFSYFGRHETYYAKYEKAFAKLEKAKEDVHKRTALRTTRRKTLSRILLYCGALLTLLAAIYASSVHLDIDKTSFECLCFLE